MSYRGNPYEVVMWSSFATAPLSVTAAGDARCKPNIWSAGVTYGDNAGFAAWGPGFMTHMVKAIGVETLANEADAVPFYLRNRPQAGTVVDVMTFPIPTTAATGKIALRYATALIEVAPGEKLVLQVTTAVNGMRGIAYLLVEPRWTHPATMAGVTTATG